MSGSRVDMWRRRTVVAAAVGALACAASAAWSIRASRAVEPRLPEASVAAPAIDPPAPGPEPLEMRGFAKLLSVPPPPVPVAEDPRAVKEGTRFSLIGISDGPDGLVAAVHDREDDRVHFVREGDLLGKATVKRVGSREVELAGGAGESTERTMRLRDPRPPGSTSAPAGTSTAPTSTAAKGSA